MKKARNSPLLCVVFLVLVASAQAQEIPPDATPAELHTAGLQALQARQYERAATLLQRVTELDAKHKYAWNNLGRAYLGLQREEDAVACFRRQIEINPFDEYSYNNLGMALVKLGKNEDAEAAFRKQIEVNPLDKWAHRNLGRLLMDARRFKEAIASFDTASRITPEDQEIRMLMVVAYQNNGEREKSQALLKEIMSAGMPAGFFVPTDPMTKKLKGIMDADRALTNARKSIAELSGQLKRLDPLSPKESDLENSRQLFAAWAQVGAAYLMKGEFQAAEKYLHAAWFWSPSGIVADRLAEVYEKSGRRAEAIEFYQRAMQANPAYPDSQLALAQLVGGQEKADELIQANAMKYRGVVTRPLKVGTGKKSTGSYSIVFEGEKVIGVSFSGGDNVAMNLANVLMEAAFATDFPDEQRPRFVVSALVLCLETTCSYTMQLPTIGDVKMHNIVSGPPKQ
ncbi:MAG TPA: tetratricopeptide repeat protein [Bryobacteraceae bacterium]|nr:tetratricopeptide repeat protein [Bryobacteraceae bacterium]